LILQKNYPEKIKSTESIVDEEATKYRLYP